MRSLMLGTVHNPEADASIFLTSMEVKNYDEFRKLENEIKTKFSASIEKTDFIKWETEHKLIYFPQPQAE